MEQLLKTKIVCAWCGITIEYSKEGEISGISHGICDKCTLEYISHFMQN